MATRYRRRTKLRFQFNGGYLGSSFSELLNDQCPELRPDFKGSELSAPFFSSEGTTVLALRYEGGVLVAGDRLATIGHQVASREIEKVYATDLHSVMAIAGAAGPAIEMARLLRIQLEHYEKIEGAPLELEGKANTLAQLIKQNLPMAMQGLVVVPVFAGFDLRRSVGRLWRYEPTGGRYEERDFDSVGSGSIFARESLKKSYRKDLSRSLAINLAIEALTDAADEDRATGGVDLVRGIFPLIKLCEQQGTEDVEEEEIREAYDRVLASQRLRLSR